MQRVLFEQAAKVFGAEEIFPAGQQTQPPAIRGYCAEKSKEKKQLKHFTISDVFVTGNILLFCVTLQNTDASAVGGVIE